MKRSRKRLALWGSLFLLAACSSPTTPSTPAPQVSVYYHATASSGQRAIYALDGTNGKLRWSYPAGDDYAGLVLEAGALYIAAIQGLIALSASDGKLLWSYTALANSNIVGEEQGVLYANLVSSRSDGGLLDNLVAINPGNGAVRWSHPFHNGQGDVLSNGIIYGSDTLTPSGIPTSPLGTMVEAFNASDGSLKWQAAQESGYNIPVRVAAGLLYSYNAFPAGGPWIIEARQASDGSLAWRFPTSPAHATILGLEGKVLYARSDDGNSDFSENVLYALSATTGTVRWRRVVPSSPSLSATLVQQVIYVGDSAADTLIAINTADGQQLWQRKLGAPDASANAPVSVQTVVDGVIYLTSPGGFAALDASTGAPRWEASDIGVHTLLAVANGIVYDTRTTESGSTIEARSARSGDVIWSHTVPPLGDDPVVG